MEKGYCQFIYKKFVIFFILQIIDNHVLTYE